MHGNPLIQYDFPYNIHMTKTTVRQSQSIELQRIQTLRDLRMFPAASKQTSCELIPIASKFRHHFYDCESKALGETLSKGFRYVLNLLQFKSKFQVEKVFKVPHSFLLPVFGVLKNVHHVLSSAVHQGAPLRVLNLVQKSH